jgi:hypothetical protein
VNTTPPGAKVTTTNGFFCDSTPCSLKMPRKSAFTATITKTGFKPLQVIVTNHVAAGGGVAMAGNAIVGGLIGAGVDLATGAMLDLTPNPVNVALEKDDGTPVAVASAAPAVASTANPPVQHPAAAPAVVAPAAAIPPTAAPTAPPKT